MILLVLVILAITITILDKNNLSKDRLQTPDPSPIADQGCKEFVSNPRSRFADECEIDWLIVERAKELNLRPSLIFEIIRRESGYKIKICHAGSQCEKGGGLMQIIPSTLSYCEKMLNRSLDAFNAIDNIDCGLWLLANEGIQHWEEWSGPYKIEN